jgi:hypothetical protein
MPAAQPAKRVTPPRDRRAKIRKYALGNKYVASSTYGVGSFVPTDPAKARRTRAVATAPDRQRGTPEIAAQARRDRAIGRLLAQSQLVDSASFAQRMHFTRQALHKARRANRVFSVQFEGRRYFPTFFADPAYERQQLESVSRILGELPGESKWQFFTTPKASLGRLTPLEALAGGKYSLVRAAAESFAQR